MNTVIRLCVFAACVGFFCLYVYFARRSVDAACPLALADQRAEIVGARRAVDAVATSFSEFDDARRPLFEAAAVDVCKPIGLDPEIIALLPPSRDVLACRSAQPPLRAYREKALRLRNALRDARGALAQAEIRLVAEPTACVTLDIRPAMAEVFAAASAYKFN